MSQDTFNPLNAELNPICHLLALLGAHHILHISMERVKELRTNKEVTCMKSTPNAGTLSKFMVICKHLLIFHFVSFGRLCILAVPPISQSLI